MIPVQNCLGIWSLLSLFGKSVSDKKMFIQHAQHEKIEAMSHVAASLAHEVRNPLTAVKGFLKLIREKPQDLPKVQQYITICLDEIQRTESILSEYLSISRPHGEQRQLVDFSGQVQAVADVMTPFATMHNVELQVQRPEEALMIRANPDEIKQVLVNFVKNAIEACASTPGGQVSLHLKAVQDRAQLMVKDNGVGMNEQQISRLGSIYFSTKTSGTGLGLTYSYQVIHAVGGGVKVTSKPQSGTVFTIAIPLHTDTL
ncbi:HAMP domain-containing histidine kinase [Paenibacillus sp. P26]|nr:HAMP domain-containing histidine kinase [Paenibacillus sp. P26]